MNTPQSRLNAARSFELAHTDQFTVNIALIVDNQPVLGVIYVPVTGVCYAACHGEGAKKILLDGTQISITVRPADPQETILVVNRDPKMPHFNAFKEVPARLRFVILGSSLKYCQVAEGLADCYPQRGITSEWDSAAGQCIVEQAGGSVVDGMGNVLRYNTKASLINPHFLVLGDTTTLLSNLLLR